MTVTRAPSFMSYAADSPAHPAPTTTTDGCAFACTSAYSSSQTTPRPVSLGR